LLTTHAYAGSWPSSSAVSRVASNSARMPRGPSVQIGQSVPSQRPASSNAALFHGSSISVLTSVDVSSSSGLRLESCPGRAGPATTTRVESKRRAGEGPSFWENSPERVRKVRKPCPQAHSYVALITTIHLGRRCFWGTARSNQAQGLLSGELDFEAAAFLLAMTLLIVDALNNML
jgi:hypothetical protein